MERRPTDSSSQQSSQRLGVRPGGLDDRSARLSSLGERHQLRPHVLNHGDLTGHRIISAHHSSPPLSKQWKTKKKTQWVSLLLLRNWSMKRSPLRPQQPTYPPLLPSQPPTLSPNTTTNALRIALVNTLYLRIMRLSGTSDGQQNAVEATINPNNNLPTSTGYSYGKVMEAANTLVNTVSTTAATNTNLGPADKELLRWHNRLDHIGMWKVQFLMRTVVLATSEATCRLHAATCKLTNLPLCSACQFGKQRRRPEPGKTTTVVCEHDRALKDRRLLPGQTVSVDHFVCSTKGRLFTSRRHSKDTDMYTGGAIYVDMATNLVHVEFQRHLNTHETLVATAEFERMCLDAGVIPQEYLLDNGSAFTSKEYMAHLRQFSQISRFAGMGAHHHNGVAEWSIQTIMSIAWTMMLHAAIHWSEMADLSMLPMAVQHAVFLQHHVPSPSTGLCPHYLFFKTRWSQSKFLDLHVWGCPVYLLDKTLSDGKKLRRLTPRSHHEVIMGLSPKHSSTVPLVLNPGTGAITPQYHVVFDDEFTTIGTNEDSMPDLNSDLWAKLFGDSSFQFVFDDKSEAHIADLPDEEDPYTSALYDHGRSTILAARDTVTPVTPLPVPPPLLLPPPPPPPLSNP